MAVAMGARGSRTTQHNTQGDITGGEYITLYYLQLDPCLSRSLFLLLNQSNIVPPKLDSLLSAHVAIWRTRGKQLYRDIYTMRLPRQLGRAIATGAREGLAKTDTSALRTLHDIPAAAPSEDPCYLHQQCDELHRRLGPIFRRHLGQHELVFVADASLIQSVIHNEGPHPHHSVPPCWTYYNKLNNLQRGVFFQTGEPWARLRKPLADILLREPKSITKFAQDIIRVNNDMMREWLDGHKGRGDFVLRDVKRELCRWSIEATGAMLFGTRMGCIATQDSPRTDCDRAEQLVDNVTEMFAMTSKFQAIPVEQAHRLNSDEWRRFEASMTAMLRISDQYAEDYISKAKHSPTNTGLIRDMIECGALSEDDIRQGVVDLIIASADTTSTALQWMLYLLSCHRDSLARVQEESAVVLRPRYDLTNYREVAPYTFSFMRETLRLYPTAPFLARTLDHDITLSNYRIPAGTPIVFSLYTTSRMSEYFEQPLAFSPDRWSRHNTVDNTGCPIRRTNSSASLPFGIGRRMCLGKRMAELQMFLLLASFAAKFDCSPIDEQVNIKLTMTLGPERPIQLKLRPV